MLEKIHQALERVRERSPLVHNITNLVVMNTSANALLAIGASPVMAHAPEELEEMLSLAQALVINIGTLDREWISSMEKALKIAQKLRLPTVLDPVGAGATALRTNTALKLLETGSVTTLRGNFSEIASLLGKKGQTKGVDSTTFHAAEALEMARTAARTFGTVVAVTGPTDFVSDGERCYAIHNGDPLLARITGAGCMVTAVTGAFLATEEALTGTVAALTIFGIAAEKAREEAQGPGSFLVGLIDWLYKMDGETLSERIKVEEIEA